MVEGLLGHLPGEEQDTEDVPHQAAGAHRHLQEEEIIESCSLFQDKTDSMLRSFQQFKTNKYCLILCNHLSLYLKISEYSVTTRPCGPWRTARGLCRRAASHKVSP